MKVIYYTFPAYVDYAFSYAGELSRKVDLHLILELSPEGWKSCLFDLDLKKLESGVQDGREFFKDNYPFIYEKYLKDCSSISLVVHNCPKSIHPAVWKVSFQAMEFCKRLEPDIIHFDQPSLRSSWGMWKLRKLPIFVSIHDPSAHSGEENWRKSLSKRLSFSFVNKFLLHSAVMREEFLSINKNIDPSNVHNNLIAAFTIFRNWISSPIMDDGKTVLFFGRLSKYKGIEVLIQAASLASEKMKDLRVIIAGSPVNNYSLPALPELKNGGKFIIHNQYISNSKLAELFQKSTLVVCPYIDATQSGVVLTAYAFSKPVIATNTGGLPEYVLDNKTGVLVKPNDHIDLADKIVNVLSQPDKQKAFVECVEDTKKTLFNWKTVTDKNIAFYSELLSETQIVNNQK